MRQGQQHRRGRGRNNNNNHNQSYSHNNNHRKGNNPLSRSFESNGPEVKVRGTPAHVAEKYLSLARDAQSAGDPVLAENYLQHAEHYNRIILAYREQQVQSGDMNGGGGQRVRSDGMDGDEISDDQQDDLGQGDQPPMPRQEQPRFQDQHRGDDNRQQNREHRGHDQGRYRDRQDRHERNDRQERQPQEARPQQEMRQPPQDRGVEPQPVIDNGPPPPQPRADNPGRRRERFGPGNEQPEFLRRPVRRPRRDAANGDGDEAVEAGREEGSQDKTPV